MKKTYIIPELQITYVAAEIPVASSPNKVGDNGNVTIDTGTITGGDGGDAVKSNASYNVWDDDWSR